MPTNLTTKYLEDAQGNKYAPVTTPNAVRFPDGSNLNDHLGGAQVTPLVTFGEPSGDIYNLAIFFDSSTSKFYQYLWDDNQDSYTWQEITTLEKAFGYYNDYQGTFGYYEIDNGVASQTLIETLEAGWYSDFIGWWTESGYAGVIVYFDGFDNSYRTVSWDDTYRWDNKSDFSGDYNDLSNKPTIPAAQVNSDWNAASGVAQILNKPSSLPANGGNAATVNSHTVLSDVPANAVFTDTTYSVMGASGSGHASGLTPDTPSTEGTTKFLREDGTWQVPSYPNVGLPVGSGTVTSLASLPVTNRLIVATISANQSTVSISNGISALTAGCELHVVVKATAAATITLPTSSPYINMNADTTLSLAANSYAEINFISDGTNIYVRAIS